MGQNIFVAAIRYLAYEIIWDILYFPIWWYTKGLARVTEYCLSSARFHIQRRLALGLWLSSMFKPMYGDYTKEGRIISFFMRLVVLFGKLVSLVFLLLFLFFVFIAWILLPVLIVYYLLYQVFDVSFFFFT